MFLRILASLLPLILAAPVFAQAPYPAKPIRMVIPYPPGGGTDTLGRPIARLLGERLGQNILIDNRGGASGMVGAEIVARSPGDGYTLLMSTSGEVALNVALYPKMNYDPVKDFAPVSQVGISPLVLVVHPSLPAKDVRDYIAIAKRQPGALSYSSIGAGSAQHIAGEWMKLLNNINIIHVAYKGGGPQMIDLLGGHSPSAFLALPVAAPNIKSGKVRAIGMTSAQRAAAFPEVPTFAESGMPGFEVSQWWAIFVPRGTAGDIINRLHNEIAAIVKTADMRERMAALGADPVGGTPEQLAELVRSEIAKFRKIVNDAKITLN
ncbi:MAG: tripartite tricarboxylate transporter substrate binding protein [Betaproteobacteria bacterium]|nr:tripartite tricarboxylate transporter substrate binding protein [Betaproteobacteria bacterium]